MVHPLYAAVSETEGMRQLAGGAIHLAVQEEFPTARTHVKANVVTVAIKVPWWYLFALGLLHLWTMWRTKWIARKTTKEIGVPMRIKVNTFRLRRTRSTRLTGASSDESP